MSSPAVVSSAGASLAADHGTFKLNATYLAELDIAWQKVNNHPVFQGLAKLSIPPIGMEGLDVAKFNDNIVTHGTHTCGGNLFWADIFFTGTPGVPINRRGVSPPMFLKHVRPTFLYATIANTNACTCLHARPKVEYYMDYFFGKPTTGIRFPSAVIIGVTADLSPANVANLGHLKAISPEEPRHALVFAIARDIDNGMSDEQLMPWKVLSTSAVIEFRPVENDDDIFWSATNARESLGAQYEVAYFSSVPPPQSLLAMSPCLQTR